MSSPARGLSHRRRRRARTASSLSRHGVARRRASERPARRRYAVCSALREGRAGGGVVRLTARPGSTRTLRPRTHRRPPMLTPGSQFPREVVNVRTSACGRRGQPEFAKDDGIEPPGGQVLLKRSMLQRPPRSFYPKSRRAVAAYLPKQSGFATRSTAIMSQPNPASCAAGHRARHITFAMPNRARLAASSVTNTPSPSAASITATCTATAMRPRGGPESASTLYLSHSSCGGDRAGPSDVQYEIGTSSAHTEANG